MTDQTPEVPRDDTEDSLKDDKPYSSLDDAFRDHHTPVENRPFIRDLLEGLPIAGLYDRGSYIKAARSDGGRAIHIHYGYSNGFMSEQEILDRVRHPQTWESRRGKGLWGVGHPENRLREGDGPRHNKSHATWGTCTGCGMALPATGRCDDCD